MNNFIKSNSGKIDKVYRFLNDNKYNLEGLDNNYLWFSDIDKFNDPFEIVIKSGDINFNQLSVNQLKKFLSFNKGITFSDSEYVENSYTVNDLTDENLEKFVIEKHDVIAESLNETVFENIEKYQNNKFYCLSHNADQNPLESRLMWSLYSNGLRGFVIEFNLKPLLESINNKNKTAFVGYTLINYTHLSFTDYIKDTIDLGNSLFIDKMLFSKHTDWDYENELRLICSNEKTYYDPSCISKIIIGQKMDVKKKEKLIKILKEKDLQSKTFITTFNRQDFSIKIIPYCE